MALRVELVLDILLDIQGIQSLGISSVQDMDRREYYQCYGHR